MATRLIPRLELWSDLECVSGAHRFATGGFIRKWFAADTTVAEDSEESFNYSMPLTEPAAGIVREGHVTRIWRSDTNYEEWLVRKVAKTRDKGGRVNVAGGPVTYRLADCGPIEDIVASTRGIPLLDGGFSGLTFADAAQAYLIDNAQVAALLPWLAVAAVPSPFTSVVFDYEWSVATPQAWINGAIGQLQRVAGFPAIWRLVRNSNVSYDITVVAVT